MVEKDIEVNEREITEMEEEFLNIEKLQADGYNEAEGPRYLSIFRPPSLSTSQCQCPASQRSYDMGICTIASERFFVKRIHIQNSVT